MIIPIRHVQQRAHFDGRVSRIFMIFYNQAKKCSGLIADQHNIPETLLFSDRLRVIVITLVFCVLCIVQYDDN